MQHGNAYGGAGQHTHNCGQIDEIDLMNQNMLASLSSLSNLAQSFHIAGNC
jgi:hypothetical protein